ncbi:hypothetical protein Tco_0835222, partial [Tanacetum coccineum]
MVNLGRKEKNKLKKEGDIPILIEGPQNQGEAHPVSNHLFEDGMISDVNGPGSGVTTTTNKSDSIADLIIEKDGRRRTVNHYRWFTSSSRIKETNNFEFIDIVMLSWISDVDLGWSNKAGAEADCSHDDLLCDLRVLKTRDVEALEAGKQTYQKIQQLMLEAACKNIEAIGLKSRYVLKDFSRLLDKEIRWIVVARSASAIGVEMDAIAKENMSAPARAMIPSQKYQTVVSSWIEPMQTEDDVGYGIDYIARHDSVQETKGALNFSKSIETIT